MTVGRSTVTTSSPPRPKHRHIKKAPKTHKDTNNEAPVALLVEELGAVFRLSVRGPRHRARSRVFVWVPYSRDELQTNKECIDHKQSIKVTRTPYQESPSGKIADWTLEFLLKKNIIIALSLMWWFNSKLFTKDGTGKRTTQSINTQNSHKHEKLFRDFI